MTLNVSTSFHIYLTLFEMTAEIERFISKLKMMIRKISHTYQICYTSIKKN